MKIKILLTEHRLGLVRIFDSEANPKSKHICNSHKPTHRPKIAKELALPTQKKLFLKNFPTLKKK